MADEYGRNISLSINPSGGSGATTPTLEDARDLGTDPSIPSKSYVNMKPRWKKHRDVFQGTEAIRAGGVDYLPQYAGESDARYEVRKVIAAFYNGYARTVMASVGLILGEEPVWDAQTDAKLLQCWENFDAAGTHGAVISKRLLTGCTIDSSGGLMAEMMNKDDPRIDRSKASAAATPGAVLSADDEARLGLRPYAVIYRADDVLKEYYESTRDGVKVLALLILREVTRERVGKFGITSVVKFRCYFNTNGIVTCEVWKSTAGGAATQDGATVTLRNQNEIPWSPLITGDEIPGKPGEYKAALSDLADLNIQYHVSLTNHLSLQALAYVPTPVRIGASPIMSEEHQLVKSGEAEVGQYPPIVLGPGNTLEAPHVDGVAQPIYWLSPPVDVLAEGSNTLTQTKADMASMGAAFLSAETRAAETAEGKRIDSAASRATLANISKALKDCLERTMAFMGKYIGVTAGSVSLTDNFTGEGLDTAYMAIILQAYQASTISLEDLRHVLQTGQLPEDFDNTDVIDLLAQQEAKLQAQADAAAGAVDAQGNPIPRKVPPAPRKAPPKKKPVPSGN